MERVSSTKLQGPRDDNIVPLLYLTVFLCLAMSVMLFVEKVYMAIIILVKLFRKRPGRHPERQYIWKLMRKKDEILVQIPTYNETEVDQLCIGAAGRVSWTSDRIIIQVIDDSTDLVIKKHNKEERNKEEVTEDENERNQEEEIRTTEEKERRKQGGDTLGERKSQEKRRKKAEANQDDQGRKKRKQQCRCVRSCMAMGCIAIFTSALILVALANIHYVEEETVYLFPT